MALKLSLRSYRLLATGNLKVCCRLQTGCYSTTTAKKNALPSLSVPIIDLATRNDATLEPIKKSGSGGELTITTLPNGIKVASEKSFGPYCTAGICIDAGPRYEVDYPSGISHMIEKLAFQSTLNYANNELIMEKMEALGGHADCQAAKDVTIYAAHGYKYNLEGVIEMLSEGVLHSNILPDEVEAHKETICHDLENLQYMPDCSMELDELIHAVAFNGNTLGLPKLCPFDNLTLIDSQIVEHYVRRYYRPERMTIAAVNVDHDELLKCVDKYFVLGAPCWFLGDGVEPDRSIAQYTGGFKQDHRPGPRVQPGIQEYPELTHLAIGFESANYKDPDMYAFAVLNTLLGGGSSFSSGGPGKGMYSRLFTNVMNRYHFMFSAMAINHSYADSGLFCINASAHPSKINDVVEVITKEFARLLTVPFEGTEVARAKKQTQAMLMTNLESRVIKFEDMGRQVLGLGCRKSPRELSELIEAVTTEDLRRVSAKMMCTKPSVAAIGDCSQFAGYELVERRLYQHQQPQSYFNQMFGRR